MTGILLAAEVIIDAGDFRTQPISQQSHIYPLNPFGTHNPFNHKLSKDKSGRCLCMDEHFKKQYSRKWDK